MKESFVPRGGVADNGKEKEANDKRYFRHGLHGLHCCFYILQQYNPCNPCLKYINNGKVMSFHHRVTQSITEFYSFDFKLIKLCETLCYSVVN